MALDAPNYFDPADFARMRTRSKPYDPRIDYSRIIAQLREARRAFGYLAISPQNLAEPASLEPVIELPYYDKPERALIDAYIEKATGFREQYEGCANIRLVRGGKKFPPYVRTIRPTCVVVSHMVEGKRVTSTYRDRRPARSVNVSVPALICHELDHTKGRLLADLAYESLRLYLKRYDEGIGEFAEEVEDVASAVLDIRAPKALVREGDRYIARTASEWEGEPPAVSPDVLYVDLLHIQGARDLTRTFVPRGGELLPIVPSESFAFYMELLARR